MSEGKLQENELVSKMMKTARKFVKRPLKIVDRGLVVAEQAAMGWVLLSNNTALRFRLQNGEFVDERAIGD